MRGITKTAAAVAAAVTMGAGAAYAVPQVTNVRMAQRAGTRVVDVLYDLAGEAAIVTLGIETNGVAIPDSAVTRLSGDVSVVIQPGTDRHIVWNAGADWPENVTETSQGAGDRVVHQRAAAVLRSGRDRRTVHEQLSRLLLRQRGGGAGGCDQRPV
ncbi:MAG: hypothetical protein ACOX5G_07140 [Kiritimatiellia bacterium]